MLVYLTIYQIFSPKEFEADMKKLQQKYNIQAIALTTPSFYYDNWKNILEMVWIHKKLSALMKALEEYETTHRAPDIQNIFNSGKAEKKKLNYMG